MPTFGLINEPNIKQRPFCTYSILKTMQPDRNYKREKAVFSPVTMEILAIIGVLSTDFNQQYHAWFVKLLYD